MEQGLAFSGRWEPGSVLGPHLASLVGGTGDPTPGTHLQSCSLRVQVSHQEVVPSFPEHSKVPILRRLRICWWVRLAVAMAESGGADGKERPRERKKQEANNNNKGELVLWSAGKWDQRFVEPWRCLGFSFPESYSLHPFFFKKKKTITLVSMAP